MPALTNRDKVQLQLECMMDVTELVIHECSRNMNGTGSSVTRRWRSRIGHDHHGPQRPWRSRSHPEKAIITLVISQRRTSSPTQGVNSGVNLEEATSFGNSIYWWM